MNAKSPKTVEMKRPTRRGTKGMRRVKTFIRKAFEKSKKLLYPNIPITFFENENTEKNTYCQENRKKKHLDFSISLSYSTV
jgi:hypothetical protein